jgi:tRNA threonylcarbamoyladenosine biosynthesis protein TsaE
MQGRPPVSVAKRATPARGSAIGSSIVETEGCAQTEALGERLAAQLRPGDVVLLRGELGAGKTTLARGIARGLGVEGPVTSPTFTIGQRYRGAGGIVAHLDLYRVADLESEEPGLLADYVDGESVALVEWPPDGARELPSATVEVTLEHGGGDRRRIEVRERR